MEQEATNRQKGTCIWWTDAYGFIGHGIYTNNTYEYQVYAHYKQITRPGLRDEKYRELKAGDVCEFEVGDGYYCDGTQALKIKLVTRVEDINKE